MNTPTKQKKNLTKSSNAEGTISNGLKSEIYNAQGKKAGTVELPETIFGVAWNDALMHQVVTSMQDNARTPVAHTKDRSDVRGGGRKPWRQKGTGRARHGSIRSPIWRGGGVTHGPRKEKGYARMVPKKMRVKALTMALSQKLKNGEVVFVDAFALDEPKTAAAKKALVSLGTALGLKKLTEKRKNAALVTFADPREVAMKSFRNIGNVELRAVRDLNPVSILRNSYIVIENPDAAIAILAHRVLGDASTVEKGAKKAAPKAKVTTRGSSKSNAKARSAQRGDK